MKNKFKILDSESVQPNYEPNDECVRGTGYKNISIYDNQIGSNVNNFFAEQQIIYSVEKPKQNISGNLLYGLPPSFDLQIIGREKDIIKIKTLLQSKDHKPVAIIGMGGLGKTTLAVHSALAWTRKYRFKAIKNIAFLNVETVDTCMRSIQGLAREINIAVENREINNIVKDILNYYKRKGLLIIYDNLNKDTYQYIQPYLSNTYTYIYMLATSQLTELNAYFRCYQLKKLTEHKSIKLLEAILKEDCNTEIIKPEIKYLTQMLDGLPLGLLQAAAFIKDIRNNQNSLYSVKDYINSYHQYLRQPFPDDFKISDKRSVHVALRMNVDKVKDKIANKILMCMAYMNPANIKIGIFNLLFEEELVQKAIRELLIYSIISRENRQQVSIHRLIQQLCQQIQENKQSEHLSTVFKLIIDADCVSIHSEFVLPHIDIDSINLTYRRIFTSGKLHEKLISQLKLVDTSISMRENWTAFHYAAFCDHKEVVQTLNTTKLTDYAYDNWSPLHAAALSENAVGTLMKYAPNMRNIIDDPTNSSMTALHIAAIIGNIDNVKRLVENGCDINACDCENNTATHLAAMHNHKYVVQILINSGCDLSIVNKDELRVLENFNLFKNNYSIELPNGVFETVSSSLAGVAFTQRSLSGIEIEKVVITWEILSNHEDGILYITNNLIMCNWWTEIQKRQVSRLVTTLYNAPIALDIVTSYMVTEDISILQILDILEVDEDHTQLKLFLDNCSDAQYKNIYRVICMAIDKIKANHPQAFTLLTYIAYCPLDGIHITDLLVYTNIEKKKLYSYIQLLEQYSLLEQTKNDLIRKHALVVNILRTYTQASGDALKIIIELLNIGLDNNKIDISYILKLMNSSDILYFSEYKNDSIQNIMKKLSEAGCPVTSIDEWNALYYAIADPRPSISLVIDRLIELNVDINISISGVTPLHLASVVGDGWVITTLLAAGADIRARTREGLTPLHLAASVDNWEALSELVRAKNGLYSSDVDINAVDSSGDTAAHCAARNGHTDILEYLKKNNADMTIFNNIGETPKDLLIKTCLCIIS